MKKSNWVWFLARLFLGGVFAFAGFSKLMEPAENFRAVILEYQVIPYDWTSWMAYVTPWFELIFGIFTLLGFWTRQSAIALSCLALSFLALFGLSYLKLGTFPENCGCFGEGVKLSVGQVVVLDIINLSIGIGLFKKTGPAPLSLDGWLQK